MILRIGLLTAFAAASIFFFVTVGISDGHSASYNFPWAVQYLDTFNLSSFLPRHLPGLWNGLGGYDFFFYAPIPFWFVAAFVETLVFFHSNDLPCSIPVLANSRWLAGSESLTVSSCCLFCVKK